MEFPHIGQQCSDPTCNRLDFLPVKCDACELVFCHDHMTYRLHNCEKGKLRDFQVPVCPLCNRPVASKRGDPPDIAVGAHIDRDCQSDSAVGRRKVFANRCSMEGCKKKEIVPIVCRDCQRNFCLTHRFPSDHNCSTVKALPKAKTQLSKKQVHRNEGLNYEYTAKAAAIQGNMTEDEALAHALSLSLQEEPRGPNAQPRPTPRQNHGNNENGNQCQIS